MKQGGELARTEMPARSKQMTRTEFTRKPGTRALACKPVIDTGFSPGVKLDTRTRAGNGDPEQACCEACAIWLGLYGGQVQHIVARLAGGRGPKAPWWINHIVNAALLCGTPFTGDHGRCEKRDPAMGEDGMGFWLPSTADPSVTPFMLHGRLRAWRTVGGGYQDYAPAGAA